MYRQVTDDGGFIIRVFINKSGHITDILVIKKFLYSQFIFRSYHFFKLLLQRFFGFDFWDCFNVIYSWKGKLFGATEMVINDQKLES